MVISCLLTVSVGELTILYQTSYICLFSHFNRHCILDIYIMWSGTASDDLTIREWNDLLLLDRNSFALPKLHIKR